MLALLSNPKIHLLLGQPEQAIAKLQTALTTYPKAPEFDDNPR